MEEVKKEEVTKEVISGNDIVNLFPTAPSSKIKVEHDGKLLEFEVIPLDNTTFANIGDKIKITNVDITASDSTLAGMKIISDLYWPAIKVVLPKCGVNPKFIDGLSTDPNTIPIEKIKLSVAVALLDQILIISGLGTEKELERKK